MEFHPVIIYLIGVPTVVFIFECVYHALGEKHIRKLEKNGEVFIDNEFRTTQFMCAFLWPVMLMILAVYATYKLLSLTAKGLVKGGLWFVCAVVGAKAASSDWLSKRKRKKMLEKCVVTPMLVDHDDWQPADLTGVHKEKNA